MDIIVIQSLSIIVYKICSLATGLGLSLMGFKLFMAGVWGNAGDAEGGFGDNRIIIKKAAPGTFFVLFGAIVIGITLLQGLQFYGANEKGCLYHEKPNLPD